MCLSRKEQQNQPIGFFGEVFNLQEKSPGASAAFSKVLAPTLLLQSSGRGVFFWLVGAVASVFLVFFLFQKEELYKVVVFFK